MEYKRKFKSLQVAMTMLSLCVASMAYGDSVTEPAQGPLFTQVQMPAPNIMLSVDTSGSMGAMVVPDLMLEAIWGGGTIGMYSATFHPDDKGLTGYVYSATRLTYVLSSEHDAGNINPAAAIGRSPQLNKIYYNPAIRYRPWRNASGGYMPEYPAAAAPFYADRPGTGTVDLTLFRQNRAFANSAANRYTFHCRTMTGGCVAGTFQVTPALYFIYKGPGAQDPGFGYTNTNTNIRNTNNYDVYAISDPAYSSSGFNITQIYSSAGYNVSNPNAAGYVKIDRSDCGIVGGDVVCTQAQELQNFSNWYVYYRGRLRTAVGSMAETFAQDYGMEYRLGWGDYANNAGNIDGVGTFFGVRQGVRAYENGSAHRNNLYSFLYGLENNSTNNSTPTQSALNGIGTYFSSNLQKGPWDAEPGFGSGAPFISCRKAYAILFTDGGWNENPPLTTNFDGQNGPVITSADGSTTYQYTPSFPYQDTHGGTLADMAMYYWYRDLQPGLANNVPTSSSNPAFWQHLVTHTIGFGVSGTLTPQDPVPAGTVWPHPGANNDASNPARIDDLWHAAVNGHGTFSSASDVTKLVDSLRSIMESMAVQDTPSMHRITATEYLEATNRAYVPSYTTGRWSGELASYAINTSSGSITGSALWKASEQMPEVSDRNIWIGTLNTHGAPDTDVLAFTWSQVSGNSDLSAVLNEDLVAYLRGDETNASANGFRERPKDSSSNPIILGDIINSKPVYVGKGSSAGYGALPTDALGREQYSLYYSKKGDRTPMVFVGANDGMLHAFNAETGEETFAYIPVSVLGKLPDLALPAFETDHLYYVDGQLNLVDAAIGSGCLTLDDISCWRNVLLGSTGAGSKGVFAFDVTHPSQYAYSPTADKIKSTLLWELTPESAGMENLGFVLQPLQAGYTKGGQWVGVFGNGAHSHSTKASLFIVNLKTGALIKEIVVGNSGHNGLMGVNLILDSNKTIIGAYAGDLQGNIWRFDLNDSDPSNWRSFYRASSNVNSAAKPFFTAKNGRPIFQAPRYEAYAGDANQGYMVLFGTGKYYDLDDKFETAVDALYGVWDKGDAITDPVATALLERKVQTITVDGKTYYDLVNQEAMDWTSKQGWWMPLSWGSKQRSIYTPTVSGENVLFTTIFTGAVSSSAEDCVVKGLESGLVIVNLYSGGYSSIKLDTNGDGIVDDRDTVVIGGPVDNAGEPNILTNPNMDASDADGNVKCPVGTVYGGIDSMGTICHDANDNTAWSQVF